MLKYSIEIETESNIWIEVSSGSAIGHKNIDKINKLAGRRLKLKVLEAEDLPSIKSLSIYLTE